MTLPTLCAICTHRRLLLDAVANQERLFRAQRAAGKLMTAQLEASAEIRRILLDHRHHVEGASA